MYCTFFKAFPVVPFIRDLVRATYSHCNDIYITYTSKHTVNGDGIISVRYLEKAKLLGDFPTPPNLALRRNL